MALQGTLDTFALSDLVQLLATTTKTGELSLDGDRGAGRLWFVDGDLAAGEPADSGRATDALFALLRFEEGSFRFDADVALPEQLTREDAMEALAAAQERLEAWRPVEALVPSLGVTLVLRAELAAEQVSVDRQTWRGLVAVGGGTTAGAFAAALQMDEITAAETIKGLVDDGLVEVGPEAPALDEVVAAVEELLVVEPEAAPVDEAPVPTLADALPAEPAVEAPLADAPARAEELVAEAEAEADPLGELAPAPPWNFAGDPEPEAAAPNGADPASWEDPTWVADDVTAAAPRPSLRSLNRSVVPQAVPEISPEISPEVESPAAALAEAGPVEDAPAVPSAEERDTQSLWGARPEEPAAGSLDVALDSHFGAGSGDHSYLGLGEGAGFLPEPLPEAAPAPEPAAQAPAGPAVEEPVVAEAPDSAWPGPAMAEDDLALQLDALSPAAARAVAAAAASDRGRDDDSDAGRRVLRRIINSGRN